VCGCGRCVCRLGQFKLNSEAVRRVLEDRLGLDGALTPRDRV